VTQSAPLNRAFLTVVALLGWLGIVLQLWVSARPSMHNGHSVWHGIVQALCYFTVLTNILITLIATRLASVGPRAFLARRGDARGRGRLHRGRGALYALLLNALWRPPDCTSSPMRSCTR
jgi:hypothetical protein